MTMTTISSIMVKPACRAWRDWVMDFMVRMVGTSCVCG
jgi:hypothetical protein